MISKFFINRPIFAIVLSLLIVIAGLVSSLRLPVARFPEITPPTITVQAFYPGASAATVAQSLAAPIEQELSGVSNLTYFQSFSANDGGYNLTATFEIGTDIDQAAIEVQNRIKLAEPRLPQETVRQGIIVTKASTALLSVITLKSKNSAHDGLFLNGYATNNILDVLKRVQGVGRAQVFGARDYSMRVWLNPDQMAAKAMTVSDIASAIREQNGLYAAGRIGASPNDGMTELTVPVITQGRLQSVEEFENVVLRAQPDGSHVLLKDVAQVELGARTYDLVGRQDGEDTTFILLYLQPDANALRTETGVLNAMEELTKSFPKGMYYETPYDSTPFIRIAIKEVLKTFGEAMLLVSLVVLMFLGTWRASVIPLVAVPVAIIGTFTGMLALGFSINSLTLFGLVLAIGIVVDDAIIVVENVERIMNEEGLPVRAATERAMEQVTGPIIAIVLVLSAVFLPVAFLGGLTGELYRQFAVTIAISVMISGIVALTLSPAMCAIMLRPHEEKMFVFRAFDWLFGRFTRGYTAAIRMTIRLGIVTILLFGGMLWVTWDLFKKVPGGFIPQEDQGFFIVSVLLPPGATIERTTEVLGRVEKFLMGMPEVRHVVTLGGLDFLAGGSASTSAGLMFVTLKSWDERPDPSQHVDALVGKTFGAMMAMDDAFVIAFNPPPVQGLGLRAGFEFQLQDRSNGSPADLANTLNTFMAASSQRQEITRLNGIFNVAMPQLYMEVDRLRAKIRGVSISETYDTLQALLGTLYVNDFVKFGRIYRVQIEAANQFRRSPQMINRFAVRNRTGDMVPLSDLVSVQHTAGPNVISRFNGYPAVQVTGEPAHGHSTGEAIRVMEELARTKLPPGYAFEWSGASYQEIKAGNQAPYIIAFGLLIVFLVLAAQYDRWSLPFAVMLGIPSGAFGAIIAIWLRDIPKDIYFQISLLTLIGLAAKNAILIVEFSSVLREQGRGIVEAAVEAARVRLRPFIMTSMAFVLGVLPLAIADGAGAASRHSIGTGIMGGMLAATFLDMFFVPLFFVMVQWTSERLGRRQAGPPTPAAAKAQGDGEDPEKTAPMGTTYTFPDKKG